jgi:cyclohexanecarboxylate-CoA ligase
MAATSFERRLRPTLVHARAPYYRRKGGAWDRGSLDDAFARKSAAVVDDNGRLEAPAVEHHVALMAGRLRAAGVRRGEVVSWQLPNGACALLLYRACWRLGAVAAPLHHRLGPAEVTAALVQVEPRVLISSKALAASDVRGSVLVEGAGDPETLEDLLASDSSPAVASSGAKPADLAVAMFTSGSSGVPKAVLHTHRGLGYKASSMAEVHGLGPDDAVLMPAPLAHVSGLLNGVLIPAVAGIDTVLMSSWDPGLALAHIERQKVSFMGAPPVFFSQMAKEPGFTRERVQSMRLISTGGAAVSPAFVDSTSEAFGCRVKRTYGSTEAPTVTTSRPDDPAALARDTDGRVVAEAELEIHDPETGEKLPAGAPGEIWLRGPELFVGYADASETARVVARPGRWYRSGDLGVLDDDGWLRVVGRLSDIVIRAGENISTSEVEAVLEAHPLVVHAAAVGLPDPDLGERLAAFVQTTGSFDLDECRNWFATNGVTKFKTPELVVELEELPLLAAGKVDKASLRKMAGDVGHAG